jgi:hypothetical protein
MLEIQFGTKLRSPSSIELLTIAKKTKLHGLSP